MALLNDDDLAELERAQLAPCWSCKGASRKNYCRQCDEYYYRCFLNPEAPPRCPDGHEGHKTYWNVLCGLTIIDAFGLEWNHNGERVETAEALLERLH
jgi:hypothetical protein